jgi:hypothetical protein
MRNNFELHGWQVGNIEIRVFDFVLQVVFKNIFCFKIY